MAQLAQPLDRTTPPVPSLWGVAAAVLCLTAASVATPHQDVEQTLADLLGWALEYDSCGERAAECLGHRRCNVRTPCDMLQHCVDGFCACDFPLPDDYKCYFLGANGTADLQTCKYGTCSLRASTMAELMPLALTIGVCFVVAVTAMLACKMLIKRMHAANPATRLGDGDADSVSSMQRWINERLRDRPPRYEEMASAAASSSTPSQPAPGPATVSAAVAEAEKPPAYEVVINETQVAGPYCPRIRDVADNSPPPLYSAEAGCYRNPCFLGDAEAPPPYTTNMASATANMVSATAYTASAARNTRSASLPDPICASLFDPFEPAADLSDSSLSDSSFTASSTSGSLSTTATASPPPSSPASSMASFASCDSSSSALSPPDGADLLTVSQAVALKEMMLAEGAPAATEGPAPAPAPAPAQWTSSC